MLHIWRRQWHPIPVLLPGKSSGRRSLEGCSPWGHWGSDTTERLHCHFYVLEKEIATHSSVLAWRIPGTGAWWAAIYGVTQSPTRLKRRSSSSSSRDFSGGMLGGLVFQSLEEFSTVCCDPHSQSFGIVNKAEVDVFLELSCFFKDPTNVGNLVNWQL